jgi:hypothetical protein
VGISEDEWNDEFSGFAPFLPTEFAVEQVVIIRLDPRIIDLYLSDDGIGRFVLVHEAAHARQWLKYGAGIIDANQAYTAGVPASTRWPQGVSGTDSVEYMADCMSKSYLGYFVEGSYTTSCTPEQLSAANAVW